jgi:RNA polymerase sigma factor (sigma-70 family)
VTTPRQPLPPFDQVVELHGPAVLRFCTAQAGAQRAEDCFQETMLAALRAYDTVRDPGAVRSWLFSIAQHKAMDAHRARVREPDPVADPETAAGVRTGTADDGIELPESALWRLVATLPEKQRTAVGLRYLGDLSHAEIGGVMGTSSEAARRNVFEGLRRLRGKLEPARELRAGAGSSTPADRARR